MLKMNLNLINTKLIAYVFTVLTSFVSQNNLLISSNSINNPPANQEEQITAATIAAALGDAYGRVTEFKNLTQIYQMYPNGIQSFSDFKATDFYTKDGTQTALYTDDTEMSLIVFDVMLQAKQCNWDLDQTMQNLAHKFVDWVNGPGVVGELRRWRAPGGTCIGGCKKLQQRIEQQQKQQPDQNNETWWICGGKDTIEDEGGCGTVMHAWPIGLVFFSDPNKAAYWAAEHSKLTHRAPIALAACAAMAGGIAHIIQGKPVEDVTEQMINYAKQYDEKTANLMTWAVKQAKQKTDPQTVFDTLQGWASHEAIAAALYIFNCSPNDLRQALSLGVHTPGDSDSIASIAGALVGARCGMEAIPQRDLNLLEDYKKMLEYGKKTMHVQTH